MKRIKLTEYELNELGAGYPPETIRSEWDCATAIDHLSFILLCLLDYPENFSIEDFIERDRRE